MKAQYKFSDGKRGRILADEIEQRGKVRVTIRLDAEIVDYFMGRADSTGGEIGYQTLINDALRAYIEGNAPKFEETVRRILREELKAAS